MRSYGALRRHRAALKPRAMTTFDDIAADFAFLDDWDERYKYIIDLGRTLPDFPEDKRTDEFKVKGCASQVWLYPTIDTQDGAAVMRVSGDSDAHIVKGLVALLIALYDGRTVSEAAALDARAALSALDLDDHLTPQRSNGLAAMVARLAEIARAAA